MSDKSTFIVLILLIRVAWLQTIGLKNLVANHSTAGERSEKKEKRPDTRPPVADGWAGAEMRVFPLFDSMVTDGRTDRPTDGQSLL